MQKFIAKLFFYNYTKSDRQLCWDTMGCKNGGFCLLHSPFLLNLYLAVIHSPSFDLFLILLQYHIVFGWEKKIIFKLEKGRRCKWELQSGNNA